MLPFLIKGIRFHYLDQSLRQNKVPDCALPRFSFQSSISEPSGSGGQYIPSAWQLHKGARKLGDLLAVLDPRLLRMQDAACQGLTPWKPGPLSESPLALKVYAFGAEVLFSLSVLLWGTVEEEIPYSSTDSRFMESCERICPCLKLLKREKRNVFYGFMNTETLICFAWDLSLF